MKHVIKQTITLWTKNSWQLVSLTLLAIILTMALKNMLSFDYIRLDFIFKTILIGGIVCYIHNYQLKEKKDLKSFFKVINLMLPFILLAVTLILYQKFFNRIAYNYISTDVHFAVVDSKGWLIKNLFTISGLVEIPIIIFTMLIFLPLNLAPAIIVIDQAKITQALSKSTLLVFNHFWFVLLSFLIFQYLYYSVNILTSEAIRVALQAIILSLEICFYYSLFYSIELKTSIENEKKILDTFGKK
jgi:hypothetical protein